MKKLLSLLLALALCAALAVPALAAEFSDVPAGHSFHAAIADCSAKGIVGGYSDGTFRPGNTVTRAQFCVMLSRAFYAGDVEKYSSPIYIQLAPFWANYQAMEAHQALSGASFANEIENTPAMNQGISRYDMAQLMTNIMTGQGFSAGEAEKAASAARIADYAGIPAQYKEAVSNVYALGIIGGYSDGTFGGTVTMNRGQAAVVIHRMAQYMGSTEAPQAPARTEAPETPSAPQAPSGRTLTNGKAVTEDNILELLNELQAKYPQGASFVNGYSAGNKSYDVFKVTNTYDRAKGGKTSTTGDCGGWAALVSDYIFGQTGFPARKVALADVRPGDIGISLDSNGKLTHVFIITTRATHNDECEWMEFISTDAGGTPNIVRWNTLNAQYDVLQPGDYTTDVWTRYPE